MVLTQKQPSALQPQEAVRIELQKTMGRQQQDPEGLA